MSSSSTTLADATTSVAGRIESRLRSTLVPPSPEAVSVGNGVAAARQAGAPSGGSFSLTQLTLPVIATSAVAAAAVGIVRRRNAVALASTRSSSVNEEPPDV